VSQRNRKSTETQGRDRRGHFSARQRMLRASEVASYLYCPRAWWLQNEKGVSTRERDRALKKGTERHDGHGLIVKRASETSSAGRLAWYAALVVVVVLFLRYVAAG